MIGMLWFDNDPKADLSDKITRAADYYESKYGKRSNLCFVHPSMANGDDEPIWIGKIEVRTSISILPNHLWLGAE